MKSNPFSHRGRPIHQSHQFFGRQQEIRQVLDDLQSGQSVSIVGPRRIGKTSLSRVLPSAYRDAAVNAPRDTCFVYFDCSTCHGVTAGVLCSMLAEAMHDALRQHDLDLPARDKIARSLAFREFSDFVQDIARQGVRLILILDEFDLLSQNPYLDFTFFSALRGLASRDAITFLTISLKPLLALTFVDASTLTSPFFNIFANLPLGLLAPEEAQQLLVEIAQSGSLAFALPLLAFLLDLAGCHPLFLQIAGHHAYAWQSVHSETSLARGKDEITHRFMAEARSHYEYFWRKLSAPEQKQLLLLPAVDHINQRALRLLAEASLVVKADGRYRFVSGGFRRFAQHKEPEHLLYMYPLLVDPVEKQAFLRNRILTERPKEVILLQMLIKARGKTVSTGMLIENMWSDELVRRRAAAGELDDPLVRRAHEQSLLDEYDQPFKGILKSVRAKLNEEVEIVNVREKGYGLNVAAAD